MDVFDRGAMLKTYRRMEVMTEPQWTLDSLNKSYQQGYMTGLAGKESDTCPYQNDVLIAAWEAGWDDGDNQYRRSQKDRSALQFA